MIAPLNTNLLMWIANAIIGGWRVRVDEVSREHRWTGLGSVLLTAADLLRLSPVSAKFNHSIVISSGKCLALVVSFI